MGEALIALDAHHRTRPTCRQLRQLWAPIKVRFQNACLPLKHFSLQRQSLPGRVLQVRRLKGAASSLTRA